MPGVENDCLPLWDAVTCEDSTLLRKLLDDGLPFESVDEDGRNLLHLLASNQQQSHSNEKSKIQARQDIVYMLSDAGINLNYKDKDGYTALQYAVNNRDFHLCETLLQCGAEISIKDKSGSTLIELVNNLDSNSENEADINLRKTFQKFQPGLWEAVECASIRDIRRLTNMWCKTDIQKDGKSLRDLALETGLEDIISLILGIQDSMKLVHHVLAWNLNEVKKVLETGRNKVQLELRNMSQSGAPLLYFILQHKDAAMVNLFIQHCCRIYTVMRDEEGFDMPVLFAALKPDMPLNVVEALLPKNKLGQEELLYRVLYKGRDVLEVALEQRVSLEVFNILVDRGGPLVLADRNQFNETVRDVAVKIGKKQYAAIIDKNVADWVLYPDKYPLRCQALALYGYEHIIDIKDQYGNWIEDIPEMGTFIKTLYDYQNTIKHLAEAVKEGNLDNFKKLCFFSSEDGFFETNISWDGRPKGDGFPLLHKAVLYNHPHLVEAILSQKPPSQSVDTLFDQNHRTSLHYAYAIPEDIHIRKLLLDSGCSEHVLDKKGKEPLDFRDRQGTVVMNQLLERLRDKAYHTPEPDPWEDLHQSHHLINNVSSLETSNSYKLHFPLKNTNCNCAAHFGNCPANECQEISDNSSQSETSCSEEEEEVPQNRLCNIL